MIITENQALEVLTLINHGGNGLCIRGIEPGTPGQMSLDQILRYVFGNRDEYNLPPVCISSVLHKLVLGLSNACWTSNVVRANGLSSLALALLGTGDDKFNNAELNQAVATAIIKVLLPEAFQSASVRLGDSYKTALMTAGEKCMQTGSVQSAQAAYETAQALTDVAKSCFASEVMKARAAAFSAVFAATAAAQAVKSRELYGTSAGSCYSAAHAANAVQSAAEAVAHSVGGVYPAADKLLCSFAGTVVQILVQMGTPGSSFLYLTQCR